MRWVGTFSANWIAIAFAYFEKGECPTAFAHSCDCDQI